MNETKKIRVPTTGMHDFPRLIRDGCKYVDKTALLYRLATEEDSQFFISRPRRFGKSLMLSTLKAMFEGRRELFKGLAIDTLPWEGWTQSVPVLHFTMSDANGATLPEFQQNLEDMVIDLANANGIELSPNSSSAKNFDRVLKAVAEKSPTGQVVVLIDEYDEPVANFLDDLPSLNLVRRILHDFYERLKNNAGIIRFLMMTGVTKLTKLSVFSGLNHLKDRTMSPEYATLLGYTPEELDGSLRENVEAFAEKTGTDFENAKAALLSWYDGYRFSPASEAKVCNPVSLGMAFDAGELRNYWESTGQTSIITNRLKAAEEIPADLNGLTATATQLDICDAETMPLVALMYQGGYLTIKEVDENGDMTLGIPNKEISSSLHEGFAASLFKASFTDWNDRLIHSRRDLRANGVEVFLRRNLKAAFSTVPYEWKITCEREAKRYFLLFLKLCGADISGERQSALGRADAVLKDKSGVYVFEFKYGKSAAEALRQAQTKDYTGPWLSGNPPVFLVGVNYNPETRTIDDPLVEQQ